MGKDKSIYIGYNSYFKKLNYFLKYNMYDENLPESFLKQDRLLRAAIFNELGRIQMELDCEDKRQKKVYDLIDKLFFNNIESYHEQNQ